MAQKWDYAELSKAAKQAGGPEKFVEMLEAASKKSGKIEMIPWLGVTAVVTAAVMKVIEYFKSQKSSTQKEIDISKQEIINGIKEYDAVHELNKDESTS